MGANPCNPMFGNPTVATVLPNFTPRLLSNWFGKKVWGDYQKARLLTLDSS